MSGDAPTVKYSDEIFT